MSRLLRLFRARWRLLVLILLVLLVLMLVLPPLASAEEAAKSEPAPAPGAGPPPFTQFQPMIDRPLFSNTRRPPVFKEGTQDNVDAQQLREAWRLTGIALQRGRQLAVFSERRGPQRLRLELGMLLVDNWRLERIDSDRVVLGNGSRQVEMPLREPIEHQEGVKPPAAKPKPGKPAAPAAPTDKTKTKTPAPPVTTPAIAAPTRQG